jgi:hypothetical protein
MCSQQAGRCELEALNLTKLIISAPDRRRNPLRRCPLVIKDRASSQDLVENHRLKASYSLENRVIRDQSGDGSMDRSGRLQSIRSPQSLSGSNSGSNVGNIQSRGDPI